MSMASTALNVLKDAPMEQCPCGQGPLLLDRPPHDPVLLQLLPQGQLIDWYRRRLPLLSRLL